VRSREETAQRMRDYRHKHGIKFEAMSRRTGVSGLIIGNLESGEWITHPRIASIICEAYELDVDDYNNMVHENYRAAKLPRPVPLPKKSGYYD